MTNIEQANQQIVELVLNSGLTFGEIVQLPDFCISHLERLTIGPNVKVDGQPLGGEKHDA